jgi:hypothetical protein
VTAAQAATVSKQPGRRLARRRASLGRRTRRQRAGRRVQGLEHQGLGLAVVLGAGQVTYLDTDPVRCGLAEAAGAVTVLGPPPRHTETHPITVPAATAAGLGCAIGSTEAPAPASPPTRTTRPCCFAHMQARNLTLTTDRVNSHAVIPAVLDPVASAASTRYASPRWSTGTTPAHGPRRPPRPSPSATPAAMRTVGRLLLLADDLRNRTETVEAAADTHVCPESSSTAIISARTSPAECHGAASTWRWRRTGACWRARTARMTAYAVSCDCRIRGAGVADGVGWHARPPPTRPASPAPAQRTPCRVSEVASSLRTPRTRR